MNAGIGFPILYSYERIDKDEVSLRFACDYLVKDGVVYEKMSCAIEPDTYVIYVQNAVNEQADGSRQAEAPYWNGIRIELRRFHEDALHYPVIRTFDYPDDDDALLHLQSDFLTVDGHEWEKTSTEVDEDRKVYVYYAKESM
jgi:hypothetical protein